MKLIDLLVKELPKRGGWPEGAVECERFMDEATIDFYDKNGNWPVDCGEEYGAIAVECINPREAGDGFRKESVKKDEYESALAESQQPAWNGEGLPPVGCEAELVNFFAEGFPEFVGEAGEKVRIIGNGFTNGCPVAFYEADGGRGNILAYAVKPCFRPIRTEAERKREEVIKQISHSLRANGSVTNEQLDRLYDDIADGKITRVTLK